MALLLGGCASGGGYRDAPRLADPQLGDMPLALSAATPPSSAGASYLLPSDITPEEPAVQPAQQALPPEEMPQGEGPRATSGTTRYDAVGYAANDGAAIGRGTTIAHTSLPVGSVVEVTALDTGKTVLVEVGGSLAPQGNRIAALSPGAAAALGIGGSEAAVRVRLTAASPQDRVAILSGGVATRADAPQVLLVALRKRLTPTIAAVTLPERRAAAPVAYTPGAPYRAPTIPRAVPARLSGPGFFVQIAALSDAARARGLASQNAGRVVPGGGFYRVQIGPYADQKSAQQARDGIARRGYGDARIVKTN